MPRLTRSAVAASAVLTLVLLAPQPVRAQGQSADATAHLNLGNVLYGKGQLDAAIAEYRKAIELKPDFMMAHNNLGAAMMKLGRLDEAIAACTEAIRVQSDYKQAYNNLGLALKKKGDLAKAV